jgi:hypothetical protein
VAGALLGAAEAAGGGEILMGALALMRGEFGSLKGCHTHTHTQQGQVQGFVRAEQGYEGKKEKY